MTSEMLDGGSSKAFSSPGRWLMGLGIAWIAVFIFFQAFPGADTGFSSIFCSRPDLAEGPCSFFPARNHWLTEIVRPVFYWIPVAALLVMLADIVWQYGRNRWADAVRFRNEVLAIAAYLIGTLLVVNGLLKAYSGRPRPLDIPLFGGELSFMPVGDFSGACMSNCSFVSGEGAAAGWLLCLLPLLRGRWRNPIAALLIFVSLAAPLLRVVMGAHFLSDAILGWLIGVMTMPALVLMLQLIPKGISATLDRLR